MVELLAPAGNLPMVEEAVASGANAIYVGPRGWSRRRDRYELSDDDVHAAIRIAHGGGAKLRVAFNTNMQSREIAPMRRKMDGFGARGVDGAIMTDIGAIAEVHRHFPSLLIHANMCFTYLGKCWMSPYHRLERTADEYGKDLFKGSPNRGGLDYRVCLESWELYCGEEKWEDRVALKNDAFFLLEDIPHLIDLGVHCLKVQGREYPVPLVGRMVRFYRDLIDAYVASPQGGTFDVSPWRSRLA